MQPLARKCCCRCSFWARTSRLWAESCKGQFRQVTSIKGISFSLSLFKSLLNLLQYCLLYALAFWLLGIEDLSLLTRDQTCSPCIGRQSLIHWIMREVPLVLLVFFIKSTSLHTFIGEMWGTKRGGERKYLVAVILSLSKARGFSHFTPFLGISLFTEILDLCFPIWIVTNHICLLHTQMWLIWSEKYYNWNISQVLKIV